MRKRIWTTTPTLPALLALLALGVFGFLNAPSSAQPPAETTKRALLIGINEYKSGSLSDLAGCVNDVELMSDLLVGKFDFEPQNIKVLKDEKATHQGIVSAVETHLIGPSEDGDIAFLHFSGHGSQMLDTPNGDELDGLDETIVPHDSRTPGVFDISDDEINGLMMQLSAKTPHVVFVLDSCHSGSASRAAEVGNTVRQVPPDMRPPPPPSDLAARTRGLQEAPDDFRLPGANYVLISGCRANELSNEAEFENQRHGALTHFLGRALRAAVGERVTYRDVMERVTADVTASFRSQSPQLEGTGVDNVVFGVERVSPKPYVLVEPAAGGGVEISAGNLFGLQKDATLDVFPPGTKTFGDLGAATARVKVTEVEALSSKGAIEEGSVEAHSRAVLDSVSPPDFHVGLFFEDEDLSPTLIEIKAELAEHDSVEIVDDRAAAQVRIRETPASILLEGRDLERLSTIENGRAATVADTVDAVAHWGRWYAVLAIDNPSPELGIALSIVRHEALEQTPPPQVVDASDDRGGEVMSDALAHDSWVTIRATNTSAQPVHLVLLDLTSKGEIAVLYPPANITEPVPSGKSLELTVPAWVPDGQESVVDWVKAIATSEPIPADVFRLKPASRGTRSDGPANESALNRFMRSWFQGGTRNLGAGMAFEQVAVKGWAVTQRVLKVERESAESTGIAVHFDSADEADDITARLPSGQRGTYDIVPFEGDDTIREVRTPKTRSAEGRVPSVGASFDEAYRVREETGALRAEPLLAQRVAEAQTAPHPDDPHDSGTRGVGSKEPDPRAESNPLWHLEYIRVPEAWQNLRDTRGKTEGSEAEGVIIAHPDTGYLEHPEIWNSDGGGPVWPEMGYDYYDGDHTPVDEALDDQKLDNPLHGTGSGSAIVSPTGCQLGGVTKCPTGGARGARLVPLRVNRSVVNFDTKKISQAILDASAGAGARVKIATDVSSIAMGGVPSWALWKAVKQAEARGHLIIAAAGNFVKKVIWPARFKSTIAMAAVDAGCKPWTWTSIGPSVDFAAPGVSVWRASAAGDDLDPVTGMGTGTTYATATTAGVAALWIAKHKGTPEFEAIRQNGQTTEVFRSLVKQTVWRPNSANKPAAATCDPDAGWNSTLFGSGIIDAAALLAKPLSDGRAVRGEEAQTVEDLPLWYSIYDEGTGLQVAKEDYRRVFKLTPATELEEVAIYEAEVMYQYATSDRVQEVVDRVALDNDRSAGAYARIREELKARDISSRLRKALASR